MIASGADGGFVCLLGRRPNTHKKIHFKYQKDACGWPIGWEVLKAGSTRFG
jgi:hypothetical protein